jgi:hypothetical protein
MAFNWAFKGLMVVIVINLLVLQNADSMTVQIKINEYSLQ